MDRVKKQGQSKKTTPGSLLRSPAIAALDPSGDCPSIGYTLPVSKVEKR